MINNDYVQGYFDAHGCFFIIYPKKRKPQPHLEFIETSLDQLTRVKSYLEQQGYHPRLNPNFQRTKVGMAHRFILQLRRVSECQRYIKEIGSERPKWQQRFNEFMASN